MDACPSCGNVITVTSNFCPRCRHPLKEGVEVTAGQPAAQGTIRVGDETTRVSVEGQEAEGKTGVTFGDGKRGARPPTETEKVETAYRSGTGPSGQEGKGIEATKVAGEVLGQVGLGQPLAKPVGIDIGDKTTQVTIEKIEVTRPEALAADTYCDYCGGFVYKDKSHRCPRCGHFPFCPTHFDQIKRLCTFCLEAEARAATVHCALCGQEVPAANTFTCPKCQRLVGKDHLQAATGTCQTCAEDYEKFVARLRQGKVVVLPSGELATPEDADKLVAERGELRTAQGEQVARLKDQMWYGKEWYELRPKRHQMEQESMQAFYPQMELHTTSTREKFWTGQLTTRLGKTYDFEIHYPQTFPYQPPKAYITTPPIKKSRHIYEDGHLCLFHPEDRAWEASTTAASVVSWVAKWLHCYEVWLATGEWPGRERDQVVVTVKH